jgi:hypothetical protein
VALQAAREAPYLARSWSRTFPGLATQVAAARRYLAGLMGDTPGAGDALICLSELATNAVTHSHSGRSGGVFTVHVTRAAGWWRIGVADDGGSWHGHGDGGDGLHNRGLLIVGALVRRWRVDGGHGGRVVWFELPDWSGAG